LLTYVSTNKLTQILAVCNLSTDLNRTLE